MLDHRVFPDHHAYDHEDVDSLAAWVAAHAQADLVVCTMKDWVKIQTPEIGDRALAAIQIELQLLSGEQQLDQLLEDLLDHSTLQRRTAQASDFH